MVRRFNPSFFWIDSEENASKYYPAVDKIKPFAAEHDKGEYVLFADYDLLEKAFKEMTAQFERFVKTVDDGIKQGELK